MQGTVYAVQRKNLPVVTVGWGTNDQGDLQRKFVTGGVGTRDRFLVCLRPLREGRACRYQDILLSLGINVRICLPEYFGESEPRCSTKRSRHETDLT